MLTSSLLGRSIKVVAIGNSRRNAAFYFSDGGVSVIVSAGVGTPLVLRLPGSIAGATITAVSTTHPVVIKTDRGDITTATDIIEGSFKAFKKENADLCDAIGREYGIKTVFTTSGLDVDGSTGFFSGSISKAISEAAEKLATISYGPSPYYGITSWLPETAKPVHKVCNCESCTKKDGKLNYDNGYSGYAGIFEYTATGTQPASMSGVAMEKMTELQDKYYTQNYTLTLPEGASEKFSEGLYSFSIADAKAKAVESYKAMLVAKQNAATPKIWIDEIPNDDDLWWASKIDAVKKTKKAKKK